MYKLRRVYTVFFNDLLNVRKTKLVRWCSRYFWALFNNIFPVKATSLIVVYHIKIGESTMFNRCHFYDSVLPNGTILSFEIGVNSRIQDEIWFWLKV